MRILPLAAASWKFRDASKRSPWRAAVVPGCVHRDLLRHGLIPDPFWGTNEAQVQWVGEHAWEYRASFRVPAAALAEEVVDLVADGLDTVATVTLNGHEVARTENMFLGHRWEVKSLLRAGRNELVVRFDSASDYIGRERPEHRPFECNDPVGRCSVLRKQQCQFGWDWGPRLVTVGVWRDIRLEAWSGNRLQSVRVRQDHRADGTAALQLSAEFARPESAASLRWHLSLAGQRVGEGRGAEIVVARPQLWWPNDHGAQPLYTLEVEAIADDGSVVGAWSRRIGLRTIVLDRHPDAWGESFQFVVNGRPLFAKGANWIPAHSFPAGLTRDAYARDLTSAAAAHMNMIRVWGGGIYESEDFFDLCDELGLLVWHDFMFACTIYPGDPAFLASVRAEAEYNVRRNRHRACLALWCGNNEIEGLNTVGRELADLRKSPELGRNYDALFHELLPAVVATVDGVTAYWPSSPTSGLHKSVTEATPYAEVKAEGDKRGDVHFWDVWHARQPVKDYEKYLFRFVSEFGMQSYSSTATNATFCPPHDDNVFGPEMENHQKNRSGNQIILDYISRVYRFPIGQEALIYLSQLNQAYCMQVGVQHWRRNMPRCMGALYWQLNDCWPVASWSSIEFTGHWRALHHVARRFFAPAVAVACVPGDETTIIGNYRRSTMHEVQLFTVYDAPQPARGVLRWDVFHLDGRVLRRGSKKVALRYGESVCQATVDCRTLIARHGRDCLYLRFALEVDGVRVSEDTAFLAAPRFLELPRGRTRVAVKLPTPTCAVIAFTSDVFQHRFSFEFGGLVHRSSDNFFELYPGETKTVTVDFDAKQTAAKLKRQLTHFSLVDSY